MGCKLSSVRMTSTSAAGRAVEHPASDPLLPCHSCTPSSPRSRQTPGSPLHTPLSPGKRHKADRPEEPPETELKGEANGLTTEKEGGASAAALESAHLVVEPAENRAPLKTDAAQAAREYQSLVQAKEAEKLAKVAQLQMEIIDPIRPLDSFNVTHRALLGRCWDRRATERFPINFVYSLLKISELAAASSSQPRRSGNSSMAESGRKSRNQRCRANSKKSMLRRSHWFSTCSISMECPVSAFLGATAPPSGTFGTHSLRLLNRVDMLNLNTHLLGMDSKVRMFNELKSYVGHLMASNTLTEVDLVLLAYTPSKLAKLPNEVREKLFNLITGFMPYYRGIKNTFAFRLSEMVDEADEDTSFLRKRNLKPAYGVRVVQWNRVEVVIPNLNALALAVELIQGKNRNGLASGGGRPLSQRQMGGASGSRRDDEDLKGSINLASHGRNFMAERINSSFAMQEFQEKKPLYESDATVRASHGRPTITKAYRGGANEAPKRFPEEFILSLMMETLEESYHNVKHLVSLPASMESGSNKRRNDAREDFPVLPGPSSWVPVGNGKKASVLKGSAQYCGDNGAHDGGLTLPQNRFITVVVASFQAFIDPFHWKECHYTRYPIDFSIDRHSARSEYGEGVITDIMYGGMLYIECSPAEAAEELQRVLRDMDWKKARTAERILKDVKNLFTARHTARKDHQNTVQGHKNVDSGKDSKYPKNSCRPTEHFRYRITRRIGGIPMRDSVEIKRISVFFGGDEVLEHTISTPSLTKGSTQVESGINGTTAAAAAPCPNPHERSDAYSLVASAWMGMETISAVIQTWGLHLLCNPEYTYPLSFFLQKFSGIAPALLQKILPIDINLHDGVSAGSSTSLMSGNERSTDFEDAEEMNRDALDSCPGTRPPTVGYGSHHAPKSDILRLSLCSTPLMNSITVESLERSISPLCGEVEHREAVYPVKLDTTARKSPTVDGASCMGKKKRNTKLPLKPKTAVSHEVHSDAKKKNKRSDKTDRNVKNMSRTAKRGKGPSARGSAAVKDSGRKPLCRRVCRNPSCLTNNSTSRKQHGSEITLRAGSTLSISTNSVRTSVTYCATTDAPLLSLGERELEERWNMAMLELKAQENELADLTKSLKAAEAAHNVLLEDLSVLRRAILPHTACEDLDLILLYLETALFEPDELPGWCLCLNNSDWLPRLVAVLTSPGNVIQHVQVTTPLTSRDFPKLGMLAGLFYYPSASASLWCLEFDATNLFGSDAAVAAVTSERNRHNASLSHSDSNPREAEHPPLNSTRLRGEDSFHGGAGARKGMPYFDSTTQNRLVAPSWGSKFFQTTNCGFATEDNHGFGVNCPMFYVSPEQALDTLWLLLCAIAENSVFLSLPAMVSVDSQSDPDHSFRICFHQAARPDVVELPPVSTEKEDGSHRHRSFFRQVSAFFSRSKHHRPSQKRKHKHERNGETLSEHDDHGPFHLTREALLLEPFVSTPASPDVPPMPPFVAPSNSGSVPNLGSTDETAYAGGGGGPSREPASPFLQASSSVAGTSQNASLSCLFLVSEGENDASGSGKRGEKEDPRRHEPPMLSNGLAETSRLALRRGGGGIPIHRHFPRRPNWVHGNIRTLELPFFTLPYHDESVTAGPPLIPSPSETSSTVINSGPSRHDEPAWSGPGHYVNPYNSNHNCSRFYLTVHRRLQLQRLLKSARERCAHRWREEAAVEAPVEDVDASPLVNSGCSIRVFGLPDAKKEEAVLFEQEVQLARQGEDIWQTLVKIVNSYNHHLIESNGRKCLYLNPSLADGRQMCGDPLATGSLGVDRQVIPRIITLER